MPRGEGGSVLNLEDIGRALQRRWRLAVGIFLIACVGVGVFVFARVHTRAPVRYRSISTLQVAAPQQSSSNKKSSKYGATTTTLPSILVSGPKKLATQKAIENEALRNARVSPREKVGFRVKSDPEKGTLQLIVTAASPAVAQSVAQKWALAATRAREVEVRKAAQAQKDALDKSVTRLHDELRVVDTKLQKLMPVVYGGLLRFDAPIGNNPAPGRSGGVGSGPPPVPEVGATAQGAKVSDYALKIAYERIELEKEISDRATKLSQLQINNVKDGAGYRTVSQTPAIRVTQTHPTTLPALGGLFVGLLIALGVALLVDRADRTIRDPATAAAAFAAPVLSRIPVNGDGDFAVLAHPMSITADAYRGLAATSIATDRLPRAIMVSTPHGDTHEPVAANYAAALSRLGLKVALVATAPEQSWFMKPFSTPPEGTVTLPELLQLAHDGTLNGHLQDRLASSDRAPNLVVVPPADKAMLQLPVDGLPPLLHALADSGIDVTVISGPALLEQADATLVAWATRSVLWAIEPGEITQVQARAAAARLELAGVTPFGVVMVERRHSAL